MEVQRLLLYSGLMGIFHVEMPKLLVECAALVELLKLAFVALAFPL